LRRHGWIRQLPLRGSYEFQPAAGGPFSSGDPWLAFRIATERDPCTAAHVGLGSAAFLRSFADRRPLPDTVVWSLATRPADGLASLYRIIRVRPERFFGTELLNGLSVATPERIALETATWPTRAGDLRNLDHWLRAVLNSASIDSLIEGATRLGPTTTARLGYLAQRFGAEGVASAMSELPHAKPVWIGSRELGGKRFDARWGVYDNVGVAGIERSPSGSAPS
jgi:hypothetical protein